MKNLFETDIDDKAFRKAEYIKNSTNSKSKFDEGLKTYRINKTKKGFLGGGKPTDFKKIFQKNSKGRREIAATLSFQRNEKKKIEKETLDKIAKTKKLKKIGKIGVGVAATAGAAEAAKKIYDKKKKNQNKK
jgi:hypothetical protein